MASPTSVRVAFSSAASFSRGMNGADRIHTLHGMVAYGPSAMIGKPVRLVLTTDELRALRDKLTHELQHFKAELEPSPELTLTLVPEEPS